MLQFEKSTFLLPGLSGVTYQLALLMKYALEAYRRGATFTLTTENASFNGFDDVVIEYADHIEAIQVKHGFKINSRLDFLTKAGGGFKLLEKYFESWNTIKKQQLQGLRQQKRIDFIFYTNKFPQFTFNRNDYEQEVYDSNTNKFKETFIRNDVNLTPIARARRDVLFTALGNASEEDKRNFLRDINFQPRQLRVEDLENWLQREFFREHGYVSKEYYESFFRGMLVWLRSFNEVRDKKTLSEVQNNETIGRFFESIDSRIALHYLVGITQDYVHRKITEFPRLYTGSGTLASLIRFHQNDRVILVKGSSRILMTTLMMDFIRERGLEKRGYVFIKANIFLSDKNRENLLKGLKANLYPGEQNNNQIPLVIIDKADELLTEEAIYREIVEQNQHCQFIFLGSETSQLANAQTLTLSVEATQLTQLVVHFHDLTINVFGKKYTYQDISQHPIPSIRQLAHNPDIFQIIDQEDDQEIDPLDEKIHPNLSWQQPVYPIQGILSQNHNDKAECQIQADTKDDLPEAFQTYFVKEFSERTDKKAIHIRMLSAQEQLNLQSPGEYCIVTNQNMIGINLPLHSSAVFEHHTKTTDLLIKSGSTNLSVIYADAGMGKSHLLKRLLQQRLTRDIAAGEYAFVFLIEATDIVHLQENITLDNHEEIITQLIKMMGYNGRALVNWELDLIKNALSDKSLLILLDGFDEVNQVQYDTHQSVFEALFRYGHVIVSARTDTQLSFQPNKVYALKPFDDITDILGLIDECIEKQTDNEFIRAPEARALINETLQESASFSKLLSVPLNLILFIENITTPNVFITKEMLTDLQRISIYENFLLRKLKVLFVDKLKTDEDQFTEQELLNLGISSIKRIAHIAYHQLAFGEQRDYFSRQSLNDKLLSRLGITLEVEQEDKISLRFQHKTLQEFFAALHIAIGLGHRRSQEKFINVIKNQRYNPAFLVTAQFISALLIRRHPYIKDSLMGLECFCKGIIAQPQDIIGYRHVMLIRSIFTSADLEHIRYRKNYFSQMIQIPQIAGFSNPPIQMKAKKPLSLSDLLQILIRSVGFDYRRSPIESFAADQLANVKDDVFIKNNFLDLFSKFHQLKLRNLSDPSYINLLGVICYVLACWSKFINYEINNEDELLRVIILHLNRTLSDSSRSDFRAALCNLSLKNFSNITKLKEESERWSLTEYAVSCLQNSGQTQENLLKWISDLLEKPSNSHKILTYINIINIISNEFFLKNYEKYFNLIFKIFSEEILKGESQLYLPDLLFGPSLDLFLVLYSTINEEKAIKLVQLIRDARGHQRMNTENKNKLFKFLEILSSKDIAKEIIEAFIQELYISPQDSNNMIPILLKYKFSIPINFLIQQHHINTQNQFILAKKFLTLPPAEFTNPLLVKFVLDHTYNLIESFKILKEEKHVNILDHEAIGKNPELEITQILKKGDYRSAEAFDLLVSLRGSKEALQIYFETKPDNKYFSILPKALALMDFTSVYEQWAIFSYEITQKNIAAINDSRPFVIVMEYIFLHKFALVMEESKITIFTTENPIELSIPNVTHCDFFEECIQYCANRARQLWPDIYNKLASVSSIPQSSLGLHWHGIFMSRDRVPVSATPPSSPQSKPF